MVAVALAHRGGVVFLVLLDLNHLGRAGLARTGERRSAKARGRGAFQVHAHQGVLDHGNVLRLDRQLTQRLLGNELLLVRDHVNDFAHQVRLHLETVVGHGGGGVGQLQHGEAVVALANAQRDGFARVPLLLLGLLVGALLPCRRRQQPAHLTLDVNAGELTKTERRHLVMDGVHAEVVGQHVVVGVTRLHDGLVHVHQPMPAFLVVTEAVATEHEKAGVADVLLWRAFAGLQRRQRHEGLVGGARRIGATQSPVEQRLVERLVECLPVFRVDAFHEQVGVEGGFAHKRQHFARAGVNRHHRATAVAKQVFNQLLQTDVDRQHHRVARCRRVARQLAHGSPASRGFDLLHPGDAVQLPFVALLDAELADVVRALVVGLVFRFVQRLLLGLVDAADVADHMAGEFAIGVVAKQPRLDVHAGKAKPLRRKASHFFVSEPGADRQRLEALGLLQQALEATAVARLHIDHLRQRVDGVLQPDGQLRRRDFERIGRIVGRQHHPVAVQDQTAIGHDRHDGGAVVFGALVELFMLEDLQHHEASGQHREGQQDHRTGHQHTGPKP